MDIASKLPEGVEYVSAETRICRTVRRACAGRNIHATANYDAAGTWTAMESGILDTSLERRWHRDAVRLVKEFSPRPMVQPSRTPLRWAVRPDRLNRRTTPRARPSRSAARPQAPSSTLPTPRGPSAPVTTSPLRGVTRCVCSTRGGSHTEDDSGGTSPRRLTPTGTTCSTACRSAFPTRSRSSRSRRRAVRDRAHS